MGKNVTDDFGGKKFFIQGHVKVNNKTRTGSMLGKKQNRQVSPCHRP
jgi:hypothetical protein